MNIKLRVTGMHCEGCENSIQKLLPRIESVTDVKADRNEESVSLNYNGHIEVLNAVKNKIEELGYHVI